MKAITVLIYRNYSKMFKNWNLLVYRRKKRYIKKKIKIIISDTVNTITEPD
jgi:hypothetical protein